MIETLKKSIYFSFINSESVITNEFATDLIVNEYSQGKKMLTELSQELLGSDNFRFSVAFITLSGITPLLSIFEELESRGVKGKILTTDYLHFTEPKALEKLISFKNIEVRIYKSNGNVGFHTKGYIMDKKEYSCIITGSSNLTISALTTNKEWNSRMYVHRDGAMYKQVINEFNNLWDSSKEVNLEQYIKKYNENRKNKVKTISLEKLKPNNMQKKFIDSFNSSINLGKKRGILISATGTGKTYASAFALKNAKSILFIVHREQLARQAMETYIKVLGKNKKMEIYSGNNKKITSKYIFATIQTLSKNLDKFLREEFEYIVIDETHRAASKSYKKVLEYFNPKIFLGMTATTSRTDGIDICNLFENNILYEINLKEALEEDILCPFHYFAITEYLDDEFNNEFKDFNKLVDEKRVDYIISKLKIYGYSGIKPKGLIFCSRNEEAKELSKIFNERGYKTSYLNGMDSQEKREKEIDKLVNDKLEYIFTVDIFNEGVDIPEINQIIMLRPTVSPIVFLQQLGRGLRKHNSKEFVVVLDFIGNYTTNYMIPLAFSSKSKYTKDDMKKYVLTMNSIVPGYSSINFDEISKKRIFESINKFKLNVSKIVVEEYLRIKNMLGRIPNIFEFDKYSNIDITRVFEKFGSYYQMLMLNEKEVNYTKEELNLFKFISIRFLNGKRLKELMYLKTLEGKDKQLENMMNNKFEFYSKFDIDFNKFLEYKDSKEIKDMISLGIDRHNRIYSNKYEDTDFVLYEKYTREDVCRLLNWEKAINPQGISGYKLDNKTKTLPVFINYERSEKNKRAMSYEPNFLDNKHVVIFSKPGRKVNSPDIDAAINAKEYGISTHLFVRKNSDDNEFYYLGKMLPTMKYEEVILPIQKSAVAIEYELNTRIREDIFKYLEY